MNANVFRLGVCALVTSLAVAPRLFAADGAQHPARLLGEGALAYFEISEPEKLIDVATHPKLWDAIKQTDGVERYLASEQYKQLQAAVEMVEAKLAVKWEPALRDLVGGGIYGTIDPLAGGPVLIVKPRKPETLQKLHDTLRELIEADATGKGKESPVKSKEYKGTTGWSFGPGEAHVIVGDVLAIGTQSDALKAVVDRHRGDEKRSLADAADFQQASKSLPADRLGWGFVRIGVGRLIPGITKALDGPSDNPAIEFLAAGVLEALKTAPYAAFSLHGDERELRFRAQLPYQQAKAAEKRRWFIAPEPDKAAYAPLKPKGTVQSISIYRDLSGLWLQREKLFNDEVIAGLAQADSGLGLYFSGRDFGTEVLGALTPRLQIVTARQQFSPNEPLPAIKLPAFAVVLELKNPDDFAKHLLLGFQKVVGLANVVGGMNGQPQMLLDSEEHQGVKIWRGEFLVEPNTDKKKAPIQFNFSPACATVGKRFIFSSTVGLTRDLIDELKRPSSTRTTSDNMAIVTDLAELAGILEDNKESLISQNMLQEGSTRDQAAAQVKLLFDVLRATRTSSLRLASSPDQLYLEATVGLPK
jgi:hypothetical protein